MLRLLVLGLRYS